MDAPHVPCPTSRRERRAEQRRQLRRDRRRLRLRRAGAVSVTGLLGTFVMVPAERALAAPIPVDNLNDSGPGSLRDAIATANGSAGPDVIEVKAGLAGTILLTSGDIDITEALTIDGSDAGVGGVTIDAGGTSRALSADQADLVVTDLTLTNGSAVAGGLIQVGAGDLEVHRSVISHGDGGFIGGAVAVDGDLIVTDSEIKENQAQAGGATYSSGTTTLTRTTISGNSAANGSGGGVLAASYIAVIDGFIDNNDAALLGGGLAALGGGITLRNTTVSGNSAGQDGGGAISLNGFFVQALDGSSITDNDAERGGGIFCDYSVSLTDAVVSDNEATAGSGGGVHADGPAVVDDSTISGNTATGRGGALFSSDDVRVFDSTVSGNNAGSAGGGFFAYSIAVSDSTLDGNAAASSGVAGISSIAAGLSITGSTVRNNEATDGSGGVSSFGGYSGGLITDSTVSGNTASERGGVFHVFGRNSSARVTDSTLTGNSAGTDGGALSLLGTTATLEGSTLSDNSAGAALGNGDGGAIFADSPGDDPPLSLHLIDSSLTGNDARSGGAVHVRRANLTVEQTAASATVAINENSATGSGGAVNAVDSTIAMTDVEVSDNGAGNSGGAIRATNSPTELIRVTMERNSAETSGAVSLWTSSLDVVESTFDGNAATDGSGGALGFGESEATVVDSVFRNNAAFGYGGGAISQRGGSLDLDGATFSANTADRRGGAIQTDRGDGATEATISIDATEFADNISGGGGGAIFFDLGAFDAMAASFVDNSGELGGAVAFGRDADATITDATFSGNDAVTDGGALHAADGAELVVERTTFASNSAGGSGGAAATDGPLGRLILNDSTVAANSAGEDGGGFSVDETHVGRSTFVGNVAGRNGGAIAASTAPLNNVTFVDNEAGASGGAVYTDGGNNFWQFITATGNAAGESVGGLRMESPMGSLRHSIVADNQAPTAADIDVAVAPRYSIIGDPGPTTTVDLDGRPSDGLLLGVDPMLGPLADNGGPTLTRAPSPRSPAIDGVREAVNSLGLTDQRGGPRPPETGADMGAVEYDGLTPVWVPVVPARLVDTRTSGATIDGLFRGGGTLDEGSFIEVDIVGRGGVPVGARGAVLNVTAVNPGGVGFITVHPCSESLPLASSVNYTAGVNLPNEVVAGLTNRGTVCIYSSSRTQITVDVVGFVGGPSPLVPLEPARLLDSRSLATTIDGAFRLERRLVAGEEIALDVGGRAGVPTDAAAVIVNVIAVSPAATGFLTAHACEDVRPLASSLNYVAAVNRGNEIVSGLDDAGRLCVYTSVATDLVVDVMGYLPAGADLAAVPPARVFETRPGTPTVDGEFAAVGRLAGQRVSKIRLAGRAGVAADATTVSMNVTAINASAPGFLTIFPCGDQPLAASLNYVPGVNGGNDVVAGLDSNGDVCIFNSSETHLTVDVTGFTTL